jgi:imidazolonepropionase-like amidohydrolase
MQRAKAVFIILATWTTLNTAAAQERSAVTLFENVRIFDGKSQALSAPSNVLVRGNLIERIATTDIPVDRRADTRIIAGGGRVLMPGLSDMHWHTMMVRPTPAEMLANDLGYTTLLAGAEATATLMRGFTSVRDMGGPAFALKRAIDEGLLPGPRIYPSGAVITVTGGHGDFRGNCHRALAERAGSNSLAGVSSQIARTRFESARASNSCRARPRSS